VSATADLFKGAGEFEGNDPLREAFVEMLFALATAQLAINAAEVFAISAGVEEKLPAYAHLFVALLLIACSWVGWRQSASPGMRIRITTVFQWSFVGLLLDVLLVVLYFIVVQGVEVNTGGTKLTQASARPEVQSLFYVFFVYAVWDLIADILSPNCIPKGPVSVQKIFATIRAGFVSVFASILCLALVWSLFRPAAKTTSPQQVIALDIALAAIILLFRSAKGLEKPFSRWLRVTDWRAFKEPREANLPQQIWGWVCFGVYIIALVAWCMLRRG